MISVIIPLYNKEKSIYSTLQSVCEQTYTDIEILVVDDGSTDDSAIVVESHPDIRIQLIQKENGGVCSARNRGIQKAKGKYIALLDADDLWDKDYLAEQIRMIHDFPDATMWGINFVELSGGKMVRRLSTGLPDGYRGYVDNYFQLKGRISDLFCSSSVVIRRDVFEEVGYFDERIRYAEDDDMWWRIIATHRVAFYDKYLVFYQFDAENRALRKKVYLRYFLPYFVEKYGEPQFKNNVIFYKWVMCWAAQHIKSYYFGDDKTDLADAFCAIKTLDYCVIPFKYKLFYKLPYPIARVFYKLDKCRLSNKK